MTPAQIAAQPTTRSWGSTVNGITATQRKFLISMLRVPECKTAHLAQAFGMTNEGAWQQLHHLRSAGLVAYRRKKNVGWWSIKDREGAIGLAWKQQAKSRHAKPKATAKKSHPGKVDEAVQARRDSIVEAISQSPGMTFAEIVKVAQEGRQVVCHDLKVLLRNDRVRRPSKNCYHPGPKPEVTG